MTKINNTKGFIVVRTETDEYTVFELLGLYYINIGDTILGNLESLGGEVFYNENQEETMDVFVQDCHCSMDRVLQLLGS